MEKSLTVNLDLVMDVEKRKKQLFIIRERVLELSNELFEKTYVKNISEGMFIKECSFYVWNQNELECNIEIINEKINLKKQYPKMNRTQIEDKSQTIIFSLEAKRIEREQQIASIREKMRGSLLSKSEVNDVMEAKKLWRKLVRQLHPDMQMENKNDEVKENLLAEIYEMQELGNAGYDLGRLLEIESKLALYEKEFGIEHLSSSNNYEQLERMIKALHKRKKELVEEIQQVEESSAYQYRAMLDNPDFIEEKITILKSEISELENIFADLQIEYNLMFV